MVRILFVEDVKDDIELVRATLSAAGIACAITQVDSLASLDAVLEREEFDIGLIEFVLPRFGGIDAITAIKRRQPKLPLVLLTGALESDELDRLGREVDFTLLKSRRSELPGIIATAVGQHR